MSVKKSRSPRKATETAAGEKTPRSMVSQVSDQQAHVTATVGLSDAIKLACKNGVAEIGSRIAMVYSVALACLIGEHLAPQGKATELSDIEKAIGAAIDKALGADIPLSTWKNYVSTAKSLYRKLAGVPKDAKGQYVPNKAGMNFGGVIGQIATAETVEQAFTLLSDHVNAEVVKHSGKHHPTFDALEMYVKGKSTNSAKAGARKDLDKLDVAAAAKRTGTLAETMSKVLVGRDATAKAAVIGNFVAHIGQAPDTSALAKAAFERLLKLNFAAAVKLNTEFTSMVAVAGTAQTSTSTDASPTATPPATGDAAQAQKDAAKDMAAKHNATKGRKGNPNRAPVA